MLPVTNIQVSSFKKQATLCEIWIWMKRKRPPHSPLSLMSYLLLVLSSGDHTRALAHSVWFLWKTFLAVTLRPRAKIPQCALRPQPWPLNVTVSARGVVLLLLDWTIHCYSRNPHCWPLKSMSCTRIKVVYFSAGSWWRIRLLWLNEGLLMIWKNWKDCKYQPKSLTFSDLCKKALTILFNIYITKCTGGHYYRAVSCHSIVVKELRGHRSGWVSFINFACSVWVMWA